MSGRYSLSHLTGTRLLYSELNAHTNTVFIGHLKMYCSFTLKTATGQVVVVHACSPSTLGGRGRWISEFEASLVYRVSSRTARVIQRNPVSKNPKNRKKGKIEKVTVADDAQT